MSAAVCADGANVLRALWEPSTTLEHVVSPSCKFRVKSSRSQPFLPDLRTWHQFWVDCGQPKP
jgi:hypothetical protein